MLLCIVLVGWLGTSTVTARAASGPEPLSETETWVAQQVAGGAVADLSVHSGSNQLRGEFLESLILNTLPRWPITRSGVRIKNAIVTSPVDVSNAEVLYELELTNCVFQSPVDFSQTQFRRSAVFDKSMFEKEAYFISAIVDYHFQLTGATFSSTTSFRAAIVHGGINLEESKFNGSAPADFNSIRVDGHFSISKVSFAADVDIATANISGQLQADRAMFARNVHLDYTRVGSLASFSESNSYGSLVLYGASFDGDLLIGGSQRLRSSATQLDLSQAKVSGELDLGWVNLDRLVADGLRVSGPTFISNVTVKTELTLSDATFSALALSDTNGWPHEQDGINITGMTYQTTKGPWSGLHRLIGRAPYDAAAYGELEAEVQRRGEFAAVDSILREHKDRERREAMHLPLDLWRWAISNASGFLSNYGRNPERSIAIDIFLVLLGGFLFQRRYMKRVPIDKGDAEAPSTVAGNDHYSSFEYSLGLVIPGLHLDLARGWKPKARALAGWRYLHMALGWGVTGIALASLSGLIPQA
jgi:hypothetical protein